MRGVMADSHTVPSLSHHPTSAVIASHSHSPARTAQDYDDTSVPCREMAILTRIQEGEED